MNPRVSPKARSLALQTSGKNGISRSLNGGIPGYIKSSDKVTALNYDPGLLDLVPPSGGTDGEVVHPDHSKRNHVRFGCPASEVEMADRGSGRSSGKQPCHVRSHVTSFSDSDVSCVGRRLNGLASSAVVGGDASSGDTGAVHSRYVAASVGDEDKGEASQSKVVNIEVEHMGSRIVLRSNSFNAPTTDEKVEPCISGPVVKRSCSLPRDDGAALVSSLKTATVQNSSFCDGPNSSAPPPICSELSLPTSPTSSGTPKGHLRSSISAQKHVNGLAKKESNSTLSVHFADSPAAPLHEHVAMSRDTNDCVVTQVDEFLRTACEIASSSSSSSTPKKDFHFAQHAMEKDRNELHQQRERQHQLPSYPDKSPYSFLPADTSVTALSDLWLQSQHSTGGAIHSTQISKSDLKLKLFQKDTILPSLGGHERGQDSSPPKISPSLAAHSNSPSLGTPSRRPPAAPLRKEGKQLATPSSSSSPSTLPHVPEYPNSPGPGLPFFASPHYKLLDHIRSDPGQHNYHVVDSNSNANSDLLSLTPSPSVSSSSLTKEVTPPSLRGLTSSNSPIALIPPHNSRPPRQAIDSSRPPQEHEHSSQLSPIPVTRLPTGTPTPPTPSKALSLASLSSPSGKFSSAPSTACFRKDCVLGSRGDYVPSDMLARGTSVRDHPGFSVPYSVTSPSDDANTALLYYVGIRTLSEACERDRADSSSNRALGEDLASMMKKESIAASYHLEYCWFCGRPMPLFGNTRQVLLCYQPVFEYWWGSVKLPNYTGIQRLYGNCNIRRY